MSKHTDRRPQPIDTIEWVEPDTLRANDYNPNNVAPPELRLLRISLLEDGWTQPIVARPDGEIVDGFHRWTLACTDNDVLALGDGRIPVVRILHTEGETDAQAHAHQRMSTIRHNRARGNHHVVRMAEIVHDLANDGLDDERIGYLLQMEPEEVRRLMERGAMPERGSLDGFTRAWTPTTDEHDSISRDERRAEAQEGAAS